jgi:hypothetical protein
MVILKTRPKQSDLYRVTSNWKWIINWLDEENINIAFIILQHKHTAATAVVKHLWVTRFISYGSWQNIQRNETVGRICNAIDSSHEISQHAWW